MKKTVRTTLYLAEVVNFINFLKRSVINKDVESAKQWIQDNPTEIQEAFWEADSKLTKGFIKRGEVDNLTSLLEIFLNSDINIAKKELETLASVLQTEKEEILDQEVTTVKNILGTIKNFKTSLSTLSSALDQDWQPIEKVITEIKEELKASDEI